MCIRFLLFPLVVLFSHMASRADTIIKYNISAATELSELPVVGMTPPPILGAITGTVAIDTTNYYATTANLTFQSNTMTSTTPVEPFYPGPYTATWTGPVSFVSGRMSGPVLLVEEFIFDNNAGDQLDLDFGVVSFSSYAGGPLCTINNLCISFGSVEIYSDVVFPLPNSSSVFEEPFISGTATAVTTPEPPSLALLVTGLLGLFGALRLRLTSQSST